MPRVRLECRPHGSRAILVRRTVRSSTGASAPNRGRATDDEMSRRIPKNKSIGWMALGSTLFMLVQCTSRTPQPSSTLRPDLPNKACPPGAAPSERSTATTGDCECFPDEVVSDEPEDSDVYYGYYPSLDCMCKGGCPRSVREALERLTPECEDDPMHRITVSRSDGCGLIEIQFSTGFVGEAYRFDGQSGRIVGATRFRDACVTPCACESRAGIDSCASARSCVICGGGEPEFRGPVCQEALHCGVTPTPRASSPPPSSSPPTR